MFALNLRRFRHGYGTYPVFVQLDSRALDEKKRRKSGFIDLLDDLPNQFVISMKHREELMRRAACASKLASSVDVLTWQKKEKKKAERLTSSSPGRCGNFILWKQESRRGDHEKNVSRKKRQFFSTF